MDQLFCPPGSVKIQITSAELLPGQTFDQWIDASTQSLISSEAAKQYATIMSTPFPYTLGNPEGIAYTISDLSGTNALVINLPVEERVLIIMIMPADLDSKASSLLATLKTTDIDLCTLGRV